MYFVCYNYRHLKSCIRRISITTDVVRKIHFNKKKLFPKKHENTTRGRKSNSTYRIVCGVYNQHAGQYALYSCSKKYIVLSLYQTAASIFGLHMENGKTRKSITHYNKISLNVVCTCVRFHMYYIFVIFFFFLYFNSKRFNNIFPVLAFFFWCM